MCSVSLASLTCSVFQEIFKDPLLDDGVVPYFLMFVAILYSYLFKLLVFNSIIMRLAST